LSGGDSGSGQQPAASSADDRVADSKGGIGPRRTDHEQTHAEKGQRLNHHGESLSLRVRAGCDCSDGELWFAVHDFRNSINLDL